MAIMTTPQAPHTPVLLDEALGYLAVREGGVYIDCTAGAGGHSAAIAEAMGAEGRLLCIDQDGEALEFARTRLAPFGRRVSFVRGNFRDLDIIAADEGFEAVDGILMDLGCFFNPDGHFSARVRLRARGSAGHAHGPVVGRLDGCGHREYVGRAIARDPLPGTGRGARGAPHREGGAEGATASLDLGSSQSRRAGCGGRERPNPTTPRHQGFFSRFGFV